MLLKACKTENDRTKLVQSFNTLIKADQMGERFKLMALRKFDYKQSPPGFSTVEKSDNSSKAI